MVLLMRVGMIGTGAISHMHARAYKNIGFQLTVCTDIHQPSGRKFAEQHGLEFVPTYEEVCRHPNVDYVDVCTFPDFRLQPLEICAETKKHVQVQKPISTDLATALREPYDVAYSSSGPFTSHAIGLILKRITHRPWVAELQHQGYVYLRP